MPQVMQGFISRNSEEENLSSTESRTGLSSVLLPKPVSFGNRLIFKANGKIAFIDSHDVNWIEAQRDYVSIHMRTGKLLVRGKISDIERQLPKEKFYRIHRSTIVNVDRVMEMQPLLYGEYTVILADGTRLRLSRTFRGKVFQKLAGVA